jgi:Domain of unknown function (DUF5666)
MTGPFEDVLRCRTILTGLARPVIAVALLCFIAAAALAQNSSKDPGIGGTGHQPGEGNGIGGTGAPQNGATGVIGTITGFGSILVNDLEIDYQPGTPAKSDLGEALDAKSLRVGQVVEIEAEGEGKHLRARQIGVRYEVAGPIDSIDRASGNIRVLGQTVATGHSVSGRPGGGSGPGSAGDLAVGDTIRVSGLRGADGVIVASRVDKAEPRSPVWLRGHVDKVEASGFTLNGVRVAPSGSGQALKPAAGEEVAILGAYSEGRLTPARIVKLPKVPFAGRTARLSIEGYVASRGGGQLIGGLNLDAGGRAQDLRPGSRVVVEGRMGNGRFIPVIVRQPRFDRSIRENRSLRERGGPVNPHKRQLWRDSHALPRQARPAPPAAHRPWRAPAHRGPWRPGRGRR